MVAQHYRWDFYGLSTQQKPTPEQSEKVVNGSTFYCADNSKLYVFCDGTWYEKTATGGGGGTSDFEQLTNRPKYNGADMTGSTDIPAVPSVVQTTGNSEANVMSQKATTSMVFNDLDTNRQVKIGNSTTITSSGINGVAIGYIAASKARDGVAIGHASEASGNYSVAFTGGKTTSQGVFEVGTNVSGAETWGYNSSAYRLISGVYDGQTAHDAATYGQLNTRLGGFTLLQITQTAYDALTTKDPNTLYIIVGA